MKGRRQYLTCPHFFCWLHDLVQYAEVSVKVFEELEKQNFDDKKEGAAKMGIEVPGEKWCASFNPNSSKCICSAFAVHLQGCMDFSKSTPKTF